eukprot:Plantae.Rhodophyta-Purpureofilum_apyrenoidigerum.ctg8236.p1 GENE.Plantae.Rhodophyta-Purpureofilum_apyrenoidigerum.ctg8236~~Plantae.Rhodophyta-Purpureofilum_apyrenoidigerum.ctg8236.p1  ORF type:complete len:321 (-),score=53.48 Plantae.Rhodophyta-Purpureofilum_apyrenoidigerum.ctg8236:92-1054(-)
MSAFVQGVALGHGRVTAGNICSSRGSSLFSNGITVRSSSTSKQSVRRSHVSATKMMSGPIVDLKGKKALVTGIANNRSIAWGIAQQLKAAGAEIGVSYLPLSEKVEAKVRDLCKPLEPTLFVPCDVQKSEDIASLAKAVEKEWGSIDVFIHCLAFANREDLTGEFLNTSKDGFNLAMTVSTYSLVETSKVLAPLMNSGGAIVTLTYLGAVKYVPNYNVMGVAKAGLEASVRYLAAELGPKNIRVNSVSAGSIRTLASSAIGGIMSMIKHVEEFSPLRRTTTIEEVGKTAAFLCSDAASGITGQTIYVDSGYEIVGATINK